MCEKTIQIFINIKLYPISLCFINLFCKLLCNCKTSCVKFYFILYFALEHKIFFVKRCHLVRRLSLLCC